MKKILFLFLAFLNLILSSCETVIEPDLQQSEPRLSVEAIVTDQEAMNYVKLAMSAAYAKNVNPQAIPDAQVSVTDNTGEKVTFHHEENGIYKPASTFKGIAGRIYTLTIMANGQTYSAASLLPAVTAIDTVGYKYVDGKTDPFSRKDGYYLNLTFQDNPAETNYYKIDLVGNGKLKEETANDMLVTDDKLFNGARVADDIFKPFAKGDEITLRLLSLTREAYEFYQSIATLPGQGGFMGKTPANLPTNLSNGAVGFFTASSVSSKTVRIE